MVMSQPKANAGAHFPGESQSGKPPELELGGVIICRAKQAHSPWVPGQFSYVKEGMS